MENFIFCAVSMTKETINKAYNSALSREGSRGPAAHKMELIVTVVNNCKLLTIVTKNSIFGSLTLSLPLSAINRFHKKYLYTSLFFIHLFSYLAFDFCHISFVSIWLNNL